MGKELVLNLNSIKKVFFFILLIVNINMIYSQNSNDDLNRKWLVYNTVSSNLNGWNSFNDSYILDFTNPKILKIKTLGVLKVETIEYSFDVNTGMLYESNGDILYKVKELTSDKLVLTMGDNSKVDVFLTPLENKENSINLNSLEGILKNKKWSKDSNNIEFNDEKYMVANEIETNYKTFIEIDIKQNEPYKGAWLLDTYENILFLELFSIKFNHKAIYVVRQLNETSLKANAFSKKGEFLSFELNR